MVEPVEASVWALNAVVFAAEVWMNNPGFVPLSTVCLLQVLETPSSKLKPELPLQPVELRACWAPRAQRTSMVQPAARTTLARREKVIFSPLVLRRGLRRVKRANHSLVLITTRSSVLAPGTSASMAADIRCDN